MLYLQEVFAVWMRDDVKMEALAAGECGLPNCLESLPWMFPFWSRYGAVWIGLGSFKETYT